MRHFFRAAALVILPCLACAQVPAPAQPPAAAVPTVAIPDKVKVEGVPPIPQSIADDLARYGDYTSARLVAWNTARRQIAIVTQLGSVPQLYLVDGPNKPPSAITADSDRITTAVWAQFDPADPNTLVLRRDAGTGTEAYNLYKYDVAAGTTTLITDGKSRYSVPPITDGPVWARQGKWIAYDSTERNGRDRDLWIMQPSDPKTARILIDAGGIWLPMDWSPDGRSLIAQQVLQSGVEARLWRVDVKTGERKDLTPADDKSLFRHGRFSADGKRVYAISTRGDGASRIWQTDLSSGVWLPLMKNGDIVTDYEISPDGQMMAMILDRGSYMQLQVVDLGTMKPRPMPELPPSILTSLAWRPGTREVGFTLQNPRNPGDAYSVDTSLGTLTRWTTSKVSAFDPDTLPKPEVVRWKSFDGREISGVLYRPATKFTGPRPVMISLHGGPQLPFKPIFHGRGNYFLNELGIAILWPNYRGSDGFGAEFASLDDGKKRDGAIKDIGALLDWIATRPEFDKNRVMLTGGSYGGYLALEAGIYYNDRIRCIYEGAGQTNLVTFLENTQASRQDDRRKEYGDERDPDMRQFLLSISPVTRASELKKPLGIAHPANDTRVPVSQARELMDAVKKNGVPVWYMEYSGVGHEDLLRPTENQNYNFVCWIQFVKMYLVN